MSTKDESKDIFDAVRKLDDSLTSPEGLCRLCDAVVTVDSNLNDSQRFSAVVEHELTHRQDIQSTHYGNLMGLVHKALQSLGHFPVQRQGYITDISTFFTPKSCAVCLEAHATYNQRQVTNITERQWLSILRRPGNDVYKEGYPLACSIMKRFPIHPSLHLHLSDRLLSLPLHVDWYPHFRSIEEARNFLVTLPGTESPNERLSNLGVCLGRLAKRYPDVLRTFCVQANDLGLRSLEESLHKQIRIDVPVRDRNLDIYYHPTGTDLFFLYTELIDKHLKRILEDYGFRYADPRGVTRINELLEAWNREGIDGNASMMPFYYASQFSSKSCNIFSQHLSGNRHVIAVPQQGIVGLSVEHARENPRGRCIARLWHVVDDAGWEMSKGRILPPGSWYFVLAIPSDEVPLIANGDVQAAPPDRASNFVQLYCTFSRADDCVSLVSARLPNTLWIVPYTESPTYEGKEALRKEALKVQACVDKFYRDSMLCCCFLDQNALNYLIMQLDASRPRSYFYDDENKNWRLWLTTGEINCLFITPKVESIHEVLERSLVEAMLAQHQSQRPESWPYLTRWFLSGEGF